MVLASRDGTLLRREDELISFYIRKVVVLNIKTVEIIFRPRFTEPVNLNWATSNDAGDCIVKKSVNDGMKETGGYSHVITGRNSKITEVKGDNEKHDRNNNQRRKRTKGPTTNWSPIQSVPAAIQEIVTAETLRRFISYYKKK
uniref:Uncharacterized protein n=1 Tax=Magallana gigas TaxID=29159 RepID=A0A8W8MZD5_MAGGI